MKALAVNPFEILRKPPSDVGETDSAPVETFEHALEQAAAHRVLSILPPLESARRDVASLPAGQAGLQAEILATSLTPGLAPAPAPRARQGVQTDAPVHVAFAPEETALRIMPSVEGHAAPPALASDAPAETIRVRTPPDAHADRSAPDVPTGVSQPASLPAPVAPVLGSGPDAPEVLNRETPPPPPVSPVVGSAPNGPVVLDRGAPLPVLAQTVVAMAPKTPGTLNREALQRAFGFEELGVLGRSVVQSAGQAGATAGSPVSAAAATRALEVSVRGPSLPAASARPGARASDGVLHEAAAGSEPMVEEPVPGDDSLLYEPAVSLVRSPAAALRGAAALRPSDPAGAARTALQQRLSELDRSGLVNVLLTERQDGVEVVLASPALGPEAAQRLRRLTAAVLAEFGLSLSEFTLNGARGPAPAADKIGGSLKWR